jgi:hypothetical protein
MKICEPAGTRAMRREREVRELRDILRSLPVNHFGDAVRLNRFRVCGALAICTTQLLAWRDGPKVNGTLAAAASNAHDFLRLPVAHVMPMRDDAGARVELAQQFWPQS